MKEEKCCHMDCNEIGIFEIKGVDSDSLEDITYGCEEHVGELLGTPADCEIENTQWIINFIGVS